MKKIILAILFLSGCSLIDPSYNYPLEPGGIMVIEDQFIVDVNDRSFDAWSRLVTTISKSGKHRVITVSPNTMRALTEPKAVPYDATKDICKTKFKGQSCSPNYLIQGILGNDPKLHQQWGIPNMKVDKAWSIETGSHEVKVAIIDSGIDCTHEDLDCVATYDAINDEEGGLNYDENGHGTHVAGTACALGNNNTGVSGVVWDCSLYAVRFLNKNGGGTTWGSIKAMNYAISKGVHIINASFGGGGYSQPMYEVIKKARDNNILFVAAAGNSGVDNDVRPHYPSSYDLDNILTVAAIGSNNKLAYFSNYGATSVDIAAPGVGIISTWPAGRYKTISGTSMATPHVVGLAAMIKSKYPNISYTALKEKIITYSKKVSGLAGKIKHGAIVDAYGAITGEAPQVPCDKVALKKCKKKCRKDLEGLCRKQKLCKKQCKEEFNC